MTTQPENKDKAEQKISKDELSDKDLAKVTGGDGKPTPVTLQSQSTSIKLAQFSN